MMKEEKKSEAREVTMDILCRCGINHLANNDSKIFFIMYVNGMIEFDGSMEQDVYLHFCEIAKVQLAKKNIRIIIN